MSYYYNRGYLTGTGIAETVKRCKALMKKKKIDCDTIAVRGHSGMLIGAPLAMATKKNLIIVRKTKENSHATSLVEGWGIDQKILMVDDFIASGNTLRTMSKKLIEHCQSPEIVGVLLYASGRDSSTFDLNKKTTVNMWHVKYQSDFGD